MKSAPDGYTIVIVSNAHFANPILTKSLPYNTVRDLAPIGLVGSTPLILVTHPNLPVRSVKDLITLAKSRPGLLSYGSASNGGSGHLAGALLAFMARIELLQVAYRGTAQATIDVLAGQIGVRVHCHNDFGLGTANTLAALEAGAIGAEVGGERRGPGSFGDRAIRGSRHVAALSLWKRHRSYCREIG